MLLPNMAHQFSRMTDRARKVMRLANDRAVQFGSPCVFPGHVLLGMIDEGCGVAANVLADLGVSSDGVKGELEPPAPIQFGAREDAILPLHAETEKLLADAHTERAALTHWYIGTEHLLLALTRTQNGVVDRVLNRIGLWREAVRQEVFSILGPPM
jgi:ATP-dependent Clp protease ATP-binding subunit ClpC